MLVIPALEVQADSSRAYAASVADTILGWEASGFCRAHLSPISGDQVPESRLLEDALRDVHVPVQVAGRFEATEEIDAALGAGAAFVVLGNRAIEELDWLASVVSRFPGQLIVATPARERRARTRGAMRTLPLDLRDIAAEIGSLPLAGLIVEMSADTAFEHPDLALLEDVAEDVEFAVQVSGGAPTLATLRDLEFRGVAGTIIAAAHLSADFDEQTLARSFVD